MTKTWSDAFPDMMSMSAHLSWDVTKAKWGTPLRCFHPPQPNIHSLRRSTKQRLFDVLALNIVMRIVCGSAVPSKDNNVWVCFVCVVMFWEQFDNTILMQFSWLSLKKWAAHLSQPCFACYLVRVVSCSRNSPPLTNNTEAGPDRNIKTELVLVSLWMKIQSCAAIVIMSNCCHPIFMNACVSSIVSLVT